MTPDSRDQLILPVTFIIGNHSSPSGKQSKAVHMLPSGKVLVFIDAETECCVGKESQIHIELCDGKHQGQDMLVVPGC